MKVDFHAHILPCADHGSDSIETSLNQVELLKKAGIDKIVATPHFYPQSHSVDRFLHIRRRCAENLAAELPVNSPQIYLGAEVLVCTGLDRMNDIEKLCIQGTKTLLLEMPLTSQWSEDLYETVYNISTFDVDIVLAHVDRYPVENVLRLLRETSAKAQLNVSSGSSFFKRRRTAEYLDTGKVVAIGSDIHDADENSAKNFSTFVKWKKGNAEQIFAETEKYISGAKSINLVK